MEIVLLRHGTRNFSIGDAPLNQKGLKEAKALAMDPKLQNVSKIFVSPKKRAQMTIAPLAEQIRVSVETDPRLDQMMSHETESEFQKRVQGFWDELISHKTQSRVLLCSHSDWLSVAASLIPTDELRIQHHLFQCAEYLDFQLLESLWRLKNK